MLRISKVRLITAVAGGVALAMLPVAYAGGASAASAPRIVAHPRSVMVNTDTTLMGAHFPSNTTLDIEECGQKLWVAPQDPCDTTNSITVATNAKGRFTASFEAVVCPAGKMVPPAFTEICYVGVPTPSGVDTFSLVGAAKVIVTGP